MSQKISLENAICRAAIEWERKAGTDDTDNVLVEAVKAYTEFLISSALPVDAPEKEETHVEPSDPGVVSGFLR
jgi:hypothetical protein